MKKIIIGLGFCSVFLFAGCSLNIVETEPENCIVRQESTDLAEYDIRVCETDSSQVNAEILLLLNYLTEEVETAGKKLIDLESAAKGGLYITQENFSSVDDVKSTLLTVSLNTGGAHPNTFFHTWTYREGTGEIFKFNSLFQAEHNPLWTIYPKVKESLISQMEEFSDEGMIDSGTGDTELENYRNFVLDGENLVLFFEPHQVAAYAAGSQKVEIPFEDLQVIFQPPFLEMSEGKEVDYGSACETEGGTWISTHRECEMVSPRWCEQQMGVFKECESACRHDSAAEMCTMQCVLVCEF